ncbi:MAG: 16S rRNA (guanine(527)-N(7))-methyltransferase RsmG [Sphingosinicella sp.]|nr:16S rRNA (guanine(527)-N(7))-methyltransferase RsmG [Sphingosinicella sp.]
MDEEAARSWVEQNFNVSRETMGLLDAFIVFLEAQNELQNLVSRGTLANVWTRHIVDSAQLLTFAPTKSGSWLDLGTGAGFPGLIVGLLHEGPVTLVEERRKRAEFLQQAAGLLGIADKIFIKAVKAERIESIAYNVISARAFAPLDRLLEISHRFSTDKTRFILPKGRNASSELEAAKASWQGDFRLEQSLTDADARIIVAERVSPKAQGLAAKGRRVR